MSARAASVRAYLNQLVADEAMEAVAAQNRRARLPPISVTPALGKLLYTIALLRKPQRILEIGTLGGYSTLWLARALPPEGKLLSLELNPEHVAIARANIRAAGFEREVEVREGNALELLRAVEGPFDLVFLDADKKRYPEYLELILKLVKPGSVILADNLIPREEQVGMPHPGDPESEAVYRFNDLIARHPRLEVAFAPTIVGENGRIDALGIALVR